MSAAEDKKEKIKFIEIILVVVVISILAMTYHIYFVDKMKVTKISCKSVDHDFRTVHANYEKYRQYGINSINLAEVKKTYAKAIRNNEKVNCGFPVRIYKQIMEEMR